MIAHINIFGDEQMIKDHLYGTAQRAEEFAKEFGCSDIGKFCGMLHDIGKYSKDFQKRIRNPKIIKKVDHSTAGAKEAINMSKNNIPLAMVIAGHHSGLMDGGSNKFSYEGDGTFFGRLKNQIPDYEEWKKEIKIQNIEIPSFCTKGHFRNFTTAFFIRMMYSCLVDADYLDTESFMKRGQIDRGQYSSIEELILRFENYIKKWFDVKKSENDRQQQLCDKRNQILKNCLQKGEDLNRGLYTLTVPTGGGKTTASLGFALKHMKSNKMKRVIYVIPYTSIIDQNAMVFCDILGEENILEHHSGVLYEISENEETDNKLYQKALATENWDMPIIVTTAVQFFESLFANKSSKCRKLHNLANSIIIFDEAQTLPIPYLEPCVAALSELVAHYRSTIVLCTATQPVLDSMFQKYLPDYKIQEICNDVTELYKQFQRTKIRDRGTLTLEELTEEIKERKQILCIVNKRKTAQELYSLLPQEGTFCLTTLLYPMHRKEKFIEIKNRISQGLPCRVVATSLIEAGVDLDFPEVYRQEIGLDSLIQSAGRCNREGKRNIEQSNVFLFQLENDKSTFFGQNIDALKETLRHFDDLNDLEAVSFYFQFYRKLLGEENLDQKKIMDAFERGIEGSVFPFSTVSRRFKLIENEAKTIYIPVDEAVYLVDEIYKGRYNKELFRKLGQYGVSVFSNHFKVLWETGCIEKIDDEIFILRDLNQYEKDTGLQLDVDTGFGIFV